MVEKLADVVATRGTTVFIDEVHFFPDSVPVIAEWQAQGVNVVGTTLNLDS